MEVFKFRLKELRLAKGLTQVQLAEAFLVDQRSISNWEKGIREPSLAMLCRIARYFDVTTDFLLGVRDYY